MKWLLFPGLLGTSSDLPCFAGRERRWGLGVVEDG